jgi:hypothetical protein
MHRSVLSAAVRSLLRELPGLVDSVAAPALAEALAGRLQEIEADPLSEMQAAAFVDALLVAHPKAQLRLRELLSELDGFSGRTTKWLPAEERSLDGAPFRHVNTCFVRDPAGPPLGRQTNLGSAVRYALRVDIGSHSPDSILDHPVAFPDGHLPPTETGAWLSVLVVSDDFLVPVVAHRLFLPSRGPSWVCACAPELGHTCAPQERAAYLYVPVVAPAAPGRAWLWLGVYSGRNLMQSQRVIARIDTQESFGSGCRAEIDFSLSGGLRGIDRLPPRSVNVMTRPADRGSHMVVVDGDIGEPFVFSLTEEQMSGASKAVREALRDIHVEQYGGKLGSRPRLRSRLDPGNGKSVHDFARDLLRLAPLGRRLWTLLLSGQPERRRLLRERLMREPATLQVARAGTSNLVFPWAAVYDIPLEDGRPEAHTICPVVEEWHSDRDAPDHVVNRCPHESGHQLNTVCPFGFWGYRHLIEQPPSMPSARTLPMVIAAGADGPRMVMGYSLDLDGTLTARHVEALKAVFPVDACDSRERMVAELARPDVQFVYFYCHGRRRPPHTDLHLELGRGERLTPVDVQALAEGVWPVGHWTHTSPLVFINGCETVEIGPESLVGFVDAFADVYAAGVIGTETVVHQALAAEFGEAFWRHLHEGVTVGEALHATRIRLLRKGNLLGLAYTAYCSAALRLGTAVRAEERT